MGDSTLRVLAYHRIIDPGDASRPSPAVVSATPAGFERQMRHLARHHAVVALSDVLDAQRRVVRLPRRAVLVTFDDATRDFAEHAWPVLRRYDLASTLFVPTAFPEDRHRSFWWERLHYALTGTARRAVNVDGLGAIPLISSDQRWRALQMIQRRVKTLPEPQARELVTAVLERLGVDVPLRSSVLSWDELREIAREGVTLAAHTRNHPALTRATSEEVRSEIRGSLSDLAREIGHAPAAFCYPYGYHDDRVVALAAEEGIEVAFTSRPGSCRLPSADPLRLGRMMVTSRTSLPVFAVRLSAIGGAIDKWRERARRAGAPENAPAVAVRTNGPVAYVMSRFPKLSETFVLNEMVALESLGCPVEVFPLLRARQPVRHPEAERWSARAHYQPFLSAGILRAQWHFVRRHPRRYLAVAAEALRGTWGSTNFFLGALGIFPKAVRFALDMQRAGVRHVHAHFATHPALAALIVHRLTGIPYSFTAHGSDLHVDRTMLAEKVASAAFVVAISQYNRNVILRECGAAVGAKVHVVHCGVDTTHFEAAGRDERTDPFTVVCVASLEEVKGHRFLLQACRMLRDRGVPVQCILIGEGPRRKEMQRLIGRLALDGSVQLLGGRPRPEVARLLRSAHAFALASYPTSDGKREGIPVALMEAMACGLPVVASAISGIPELVDHGESGLLVPPADVPALADALHQLADDAALRRRLGSAARARVLELFDLRANVQQLARLLAVPSEQPGTPLVHAEHAAEFVHA